MRCRVYWNSIRREWAVVKAGQRKVTFYAEGLTLTDAQFHTGLKGKHAVCKSGHVNRHDFVEGKLASLTSFARRLNGPDKPLACHPVRKNRYNEFEATVRQGQRVAAGGRTLERVEFTSYGVRYAACSPVICDTKRGVGCLDD